MPRLADLVGQKFGMLEVLSRAPDRKSGQPMWECKCDCGNTVVVWAGNLRQGQTSSCGCLRKKQKAETHPNWKGGRPGTYRRASLKGYKLLPKDYSIKMEEQGGVCAICGKAEEKRKSLCVDHNHATGEVRGLLCSQCNLGIGNLKESEEILESALRYLRTYKKEERKVS